jgi:hypothetical protein
MRLLTFGVAAIYEGACVRPTRSAAVCLLLCRHGFLRRLSTVYLTHASIGNKALEEQSCGWVSNLDARSRVG